MGSNVPHNTTDSTVSERSGHTQVSGYWGRNHFSPAVRAARFPYSTANSKQATHRECHLGNRPTSSHRHINVICLCKNEPLQQGGLPIATKAEKVITRHMNKALAVIACLFRGCCLFFPPPAGVATITGTAVLVITLIMYSTGTEQTCAHNAHFEPVP